MDARSARLWIAIVVSVGLATSVPNATGQNSAPEDANAQKLKILQKACKNGTLTKDECAAKMAALTGKPTGTGAFAAQWAEAQASHDAVPHSLSNWTGQPSNSPEPAGGPTIYRDPQGRFSFTIPAGWKPKPSEGKADDRIQISNGSSWAMIGTYGGVRSTVELVNSLASEFQSEYQDYDLGDHGTMQVNGHDAAYAAFSGVNQKGEHLGMRFGGVSAGHGHYLAVAVFIPHNQIADVDPVIKDMFMSISFGQ